jgi:hypothetical protein
MAKDKLFAVEGYEKLVTEALEDQFCPECGAQLNKKQTKEVKQAIKSTYKINYSLVALGILLFNTFVYFIFVNIDSESLNTYVRYYGVIFLIDTIFFVGLHYYLKTRDDYPF